MIYVFMLLVIIDPLGYISKCESSPSFRKNNWRHIPFIWFFYTD